MKPVFTGKNQVIASAKCLWETRIDPFIAKSEFSRAKHHEFGFPREMEVVPYFLPDTPEAVTTENASPHPRPYFLFVGRLEKLKGLDEVITVFANYPDADLVIIGTGNYESHLRRLAAHMDNVTFVGRLAQDELSRYYRSAIASLAPSVCFETFGIILIESFREGTPVIARSIGPFVDIVNQCGGGILFSDSHGLDEALRRLQGNPEVRRAMATAARVGFETWWSEASVLTQYFATLRRAALAKQRHWLAAALQE